MKEKSFIKKHKEEYIKSFKDKNCFSCWHNGECLRPHKNVVNCDNYKKALDYYNQYKEQ